MFIGQIFQPISWCTPLCSSSHTRYTPNKGGKYPNNTYVQASRVFFQNRGEVEVDQYVSDLHQQILKTHELARDNFKKSSKKSMKRDCDLRLREQKFNVGDPWFIGGVTLAKRLNPCGEDPELLLRSSQTEKLKWMKICQNFLENCVLLKNLGFLRFFLLKYLNFVSGRS